jgi:hypothetical protein
MASANQIRGALLEEAILALLRASAYRTIGECGNDPTLCVLGAGLGVQGRGSKHQIDAIADFSVGQPFSNPQRLLLEAKYHSDSRPVGLSVIREAVGVLKDVGEFWVARDGRRPAPRRYHYQYAVFSASRFTAEAQDFAFAHDIFLLPLAGSKFFAQMLDAVRQAADDLAGGDRQVRGFPLNDLRMQLRAELQPDLQGWRGNFSVQLRPVVRACNEIRSALIGTIARGFPIFLTPRRPEVLDQLGAQEVVRISYDNDGWYLYRRGDRNPLFSFDLPETLFMHYADEGVLSRERAADLKAEYLQTIQAVHLNGGTPQLVTFILDSEWINEVREQIGRPRRRVRE